MLKIGRTEPGIKTTRFRRGEFLHLGVIASQYMSPEAGCFRWSPPQRKFPKHLRRFDGARGLTSTAERLAMLISGFRSTLALRRAGFVYSTTGAEPQPLPLPFRPPRAYLTGGLSP
jgi:hypothetical protein